MTSGVDKQIICPLYQIVLTKLQLSTFHFNANYTKTKCHLHIRYDGDLTHYL